MASQQPNTARMYETPDWNLPTVYLIRGLPRSGKSLIAESMNRCVHFDPQIPHDLQLQHPRSFTLARDIAFLHHHCIHEILGALRNGWSVTVESWFLLLSEMSVYQDFCNRRGLSFVIMTARHTPDNTADPVYQDASALWEDSVWLN